MTASAKTRLKVAIPSVLLLLVLAAFIVVACVVPARAANAFVSSAVDRDAVRALNNCAAYTASHDFQTHMTGTVKAKVFGIPYKITARGGRVKVGSDLESVAESVSAFVKAGVKRIKSGDKLYSADGTYSHKSFSYSEPREYTYDEYVAAFGKPELGLVKYELDGNIVSAEKISDDTYRYTLEPNRAAAFTRNEVKTTLGAKNPPTYELIELTLETDGDRPTRLTAHERFTVDKFGGTRCDAFYTETFTFAAQ